MAKYAIKFQNQDEAVEMSQKPDTPAPKAGDILEGEIESTQHGKRFKKARVGGGRFNDPQTRMEIIRQNALTNAVNFCVAKATLKKDPEYLSGKQVVQVATYFAKYSGGKVTVMMSPEEIAKEFGYKQEPEPEPEAESEPEEEPEETKQEEFNLDEIPF